MSVKIMGVYVDYKYRDYASGFTIFRIRPQLTAQIADKVKGGYVFCKGVIPELNKAIPMEFIGEWESNEYGWTFQVNRQKSSQKPMKTFLHSQKDLMQQTRYVGFLD